MLQRGGALVWFAPDFVQVRWFWGGHGNDPCGSFSATVAGGTRDGNRHAAVDLAERILLPRDLGRDELVGTSWALERSTVEGVPTTGDGSTFAFTQTDVSWSDGCNAFGGVYELVGDRLRVRDVTSTQAACEPNPTSDAINAVMGAQSVVATREGDLLRLRAGGTELLLRRAAEPRPLDDDPRVAAYGIWPVTAPESVLGYRPEATGTATEVALAFARDVLGWADAVAGAGEPPHDGKGVLDLPVRSPSADAEVVISVAQGDAPEHHVVYRVDTPSRASNPDAYARVAVQGSRLTADAGPAPAGARSLVRFTYGENVAEGDPGEPIERYWDERVPGAVLILFSDADGTIVGAWGQTLPATDGASG